jgi:GNAT superfamily N-acetyltransferase
MEWREAEFRPVVSATLKGGGVVVLRQFDPGDFESLVRMYKSFEPKRVAQGLPPPDLPRIAHWLDRLARKSLALLAWKEGRVVGHTILAPISDRAVEFTIFVHQDYREQGLGTVLSRHTLIWAAEIGFDTAYLTTEVSNFRALRLFRKLGFRTTSGFGDELEMILGLPVYSAHPRAA